MINDGHCPQKQRIIIKKLIFGFDGRPYEITFVGFFEGLISYYIRSFKLVPLTLHNIVYTFMNAQILL
jgi:hypothetical protein